MEDAKTEVESLIREIIGTYAPQNFMYKVLSDYMDFALQILKASNSWDSETQASIEKLNNNFFELANAYVKLFSAVSQLSYRKEGRTRPYICTYEDMEALSKHPKS